MHQRREPVAFTRRIEIADEPGWMRAHHGEQRLNGLQHAGDTAEGEPRGAEPDDLAIVWCCKSPNNMNGVGGRRHMVEGLVQAVEVFAELTIDEGRLTH